MFENIVPTYDILKELHTPKVRVKVHPLNYTSTVLRFTFANNALRKEVLDTTGTWQAIAKDESYKPFTQDTYLWTEFYAARDMLHALTAIISAIDTQHQLNATAPEIAAARNLISGLHPY